MIDLDEFLDLPLWGKVSVMGALNPNGGSWGTDWDLSNQAHNRHRNQRAKNAKAKHRRKYSR